MRSLTYIVTMVLCLALGTPLVAQFGLPRPPRVPSVPGVPGVPDIEIPGLDDLIAELLAEEPPLTTSIVDAIEPMPILDDYDPGEFFDGHEQPRLEDGSFWLPPGAWQFSFESYCLHAGTRGPSTGDGYLLAPLKGKAAAPMEKILRETWRHPEIKRSEYQVLLWAIEARTPLTALHESTQEAARTILNEAEFNQLSRKTFFDQISGATGIDNNILQKVLARMPAEARAPFQAQAKMYSLMRSDRNTAFDDLEKLAVLPAGEPTPEDIPLGRWSYDPGGYFVRYFPRSYTNTIVQVLVPAPTTVERDDLGRITAIDTGGGWRVETVYNDEIEPFIAPGHPDLRSYWWKTIRLIGPDADNPGELRVEEFHDVGWTMVGEPNEDAPPLPEPTLAYAPRPAGGFSFAAWGGAPAGGLVFVQQDGMGFLDKIPGNPNEMKEFVGEHNKRTESFKKPYKEAKKMKERLDNYDREGKDPFKDLTDTDHYKKGLETALKNDNQDKLDWIGQHTNRVKRAWEEAIRQLRGEGGSEGGSEGEGSGGSDANRGGSGGGVSYGGGTVATPGNGGKQRLGQSTRPSGPSGGMRVPPEFRTPPPTKLSEY
ncbi:MAG TPA: hypothetical protein DCZ72_12730 [Armatimonadetes bacterium]|mgnify:CR=1 FL=1|nr:hypothetical protein [Armatimonadota bacterium]